MSIRQAAEKDLEALYGVARAMGDVHEKNYFETCLSEQAEGKRHLFVHESDAGIQGYVQLIWNPIYPLFRRLGMPEIQDLCVIPDARQQGIGSALVDFCEAFARQKNKTEIAISVGLHPRFGAAQRLYVLKGYVPDGAGVAYNEVTVRMGEIKPMDNMMTLKLVKKI